MATKAERLTNLVAALLDVGRPMPLRQIVEEVDGYPPAFDSARVQFERDKKELRDDNIEIEMTGTGDDARYRIDPGSSYPTRILDPDRVQVLIRSRELESKWGEAAVAVVFRHGQGEVFHMVSHYYLQRTETRGARHASSAASYWQEKGVAPSADALAEMDGLNLGDVESAATSSRLFANVVADKKRRGAAPRERSRR